MSIRHPEDLRHRVAQECIDVGEIKSVAIKHGLSPKTVHKWVQNFKNADAIEDRREFMKLKKQLADAHLENAVLKELLKKTYQVWNKEEK
jgi:transposase-like protein